MKVIVHSLNGMMNHRDRPEELVVVVEVGVEVEEAELLGQGSVTIVIKRAIGRAIVRRRNRNDHGALERLLTMQLRGCPVSSVMR